MITDHHIKKSVSAIRDLIEEQLEVLRDDGMTDAQELDLLSQVSDDIAESCGELEALAEDDDGEDARSVFDE